MESTERISERHVEKRLVRAPREPASPTSVELMDRYLSSDDLIGRVVAVVLRHGWPTWRSLS
jgi:hypothetical protein